MVVIKVAEVAPTYIFKCRYQNGKKEQKLLESGILSSTPTIIFDTNVLSIPVF